MSGNGTEIQPQRSVLPQQVPQEAARGQPSGGPGPDNGGGCPDTRSRVRGWCFTLPNPTIEEGAILQASPDIRYGIYQEEVAPTTGTVHLQGYIELHKNQRLSFVRGLLSRAHWERRWGPRSKARNYCRKESSRKPGTQPIEWGEWKSGGQGARNDIEEVCDLLRTGASVAQAVLDFPMFAARYPKFLETYKNALSMKRNWMTEVHVFIGPTETGKTREAYRQYPNIWKKPPGRWFDGYDGHSEVLFDDFDGKDIEYRDLLQLLDRYPQLVPIKGNFREWIPRVIVITSNLEIERWYPYLDNELLAPLFRRITSIRYFRRQSGDIHGEPHPRRPRVSEVNVGPLDRLGLYGEHGRVHNWPNGYLGLVDQPVIESS